MGPALFGGHRPSRTASGSPNSSKRRHRGLGDKTADARSLTRCVALAASGVTVETRPPTPGRSLTRCEKPSRQPAAQPPAPGDTPMGPRAGPRRLRLPCLNRGPPGARRGPSCLRINRGRGRRSPGHARGQPEVALPPRPGTTVVLPAPRSVSSKFALPCAQVYSELVPLAAARAGPGPLRLHTE